MTRLSAGKNPIENNRMKQILPNLSRYKIILGSNSPRRRELLAGLDIDFEVKTIPGIDESYPPTLPLEEVPLHIARKKAEAYIPSLAPDELLITADTVVLNAGEILGKPKDREDAVAMLRKLSGHTHEVVTGVCLTTKEKTVDFSATSSVCFAALDEEEITYYVDKYRPFDKAGSYGIQEWSGYVAVEAINGSFYNVMGLPVRLLYRELKKF